MAGPTFAEMAPRYQKAWDDIHIVAGHDSAFDASAKQILAGMDEYTEVYNDTSVIPVAVGLMHKMEADCNFNAHLHNGDPLRKKTIHVPAGRPPGIWPPLNKPVDEWWRLSADDAMDFQGFDNIKDWSIPRLAYTLEAYNGWGYYYHGVPSAYLWSFSNQYRGGKYVADGVWNANAWSGQIGAMPMLKWMMALDKTLVLVPGKSNGLQLGAPANNACPMCTADPAQPMPDVTHLVPAKAIPPAGQPLPAVADGLFDPNYWTHRVLRAV